MDTIQQQFEERAPTANLSLGLNISTTFLQGMTLYLLCFATLAIIALASPSFFSTDDYYHTRASAEIIKQGRLDLDFPWLPLTIMSPERYVNHHLLYHMYIAPFSYLWDINGAKLATVGAAAGVYVAIWWMLRSLGVRYPVIWALLLFGMSWQLVFRNLMVRVPSAGLLFMVLTLHILFQRRYRWLVPMSFLFVWLYSSGVFVLLGSFIVVYTFSVWIAEKRLDFQPAFYCAIGVVLGLVINPFFPRNISFVAENLLPKVDLESCARCGTEWFPMDTRQVLLNAAGTLIALVAGYARPYFGGKRDAIDTTLLLLSFQFFLMASNALRFMEYFPAFALLFCATTWGRGEIKLLEGREWFQKYAPKVAPFVLIVIGVGLISYTLPRAYNSAVQSKPLEEYQGAAEWMKKNSVPGTLVFTVGFNDFAKLFYFNQDMYYVIGLDPTYLELTHPDLWHEYDIITRGNVDDTGERILKLFGAQYAISAGRHTGFNAKASRDPRMKIVFRDQYTTVWYILTDEQLAFREAEQQAKQQRLDAQLEQQAEQLPDQEEQPEAEQSPEKQAGG